MQDIIARCWRFEKVEEAVVQGGKTRMTILAEAKARPCVCDNKWIGAAQHIFDLNGLNANEWRAAVLFSLEHGRSKGTVVCHAGLEGNEGKSFLLAPLPLVYGPEKVFATPSKGSFPLLGLEQCRLALLDDWRFGDDVISYNVQLLWFEGKSVMIARPQNSFAGHYRYSRGDPVFLTTLEADLHQTRAKVQQGDVAMMLKRLRLFRFHKVIPAPEEVAPCACCFAHFLLDSQFAPHKRPPPGPTGNTPEAKRTSATATVQEVAEWLATIGLGHVAPTFIDNAVDGLFLLGLSEQDLVSELGLTKLQARKVKSRFAM